MAAVTEEIHRTMGFPLNGMRYFKSNLNSQVGYSVPAQMGSKVIHTVGMNGVLCVQ